MNYAKVSLVVLVYVLKGGKNSKTLRKNKQTTFNQWSNQEATLLCLDMM